MLAKFAIRSSIWGVQIKRCRCSIKINHRISPPETDMEAANKEAAEECLLKTGREVGWLAEKSLDM